MRRAAVLLGVCALAACSSSAGTPAASTAAQATAYVTGPNPETDLFGNSRVKVTASTAGVSQPFTVSSGGTFHVQYLIDSGKDKGCAFTLIVTTKKNWPIVQSTEAILPDSAEGAGDADWSLSAGTYLLQEDEKGKANCRRGFQATITAQNQ